MASFAPSNGNGSSDPSNGNARFRETPVPANGESLQPDALAPVDIDAPHF